jgi:hypothetical protein
MEIVLGLLFSKFGAILAGGLGVLALWFRISWLKRRAEKAEAQARTAEAQVEIQKVETEYAPKIERVEEAGRAGDAGAVAGLINRMFGDKTKPE